MNEWNKLSMADRAAYIKLGIDNGITDLATIRDTYNKYAEGGDISNNELYDKTIEITLPEIVVTPSETQKEYKAKVRPYLDKKAALGIGKSFDLLPKKLFESKMKAFIDIHDYANKPHLKGILSIIPITTNTGKPRAHYNPIFNTAYNINNLDDAIAEMSHPILFKLSKHPITEILDNVKDVILGKLLETYEKKGSLEYNTHRVVLPLLNKYLLQKYRKGNHNIGTLEDLLTLGYNKFDEGGYVREKNDNPIAFDEEGNLVDLVTGEKGTMMLPEFTVRGISPKTRAKNYSSAYHPEDALEFFDIMTRPITAPITPSLQVGAIRNALNGGSYYKSLMGLEPNLGITTENFNKEHPYLSMGANLTFDMLSPFGLKGVNRGVNAASTFIGKKYVTPYTASKILDRAVSANPKGLILVSDSYFNSPNNWYRISNTPEVYGIKEIGKNVTTRDSGVLIDVPSDNWRTSVLDLPLIRDKEGFLALEPQRDFVEFSGWDNFNVDKLNFSPRLFLKSGSAHGNRTLAAKGQIWKGGISNSNMFPTVIIEGEAAQQVPMGFKGSRTNFKLSPWEDIPMGHRIGFKTGEMPMENLGYFQDLKNGKYSYLGQIIPYKVQNYTNSLKFSYTPTYFMEGTTANGYPVVGRILKKYDNASAKGKIFKSLLSDEGSERAVYNSFNPKQVLKVEDSPYTFLDLEKMTSRNNPFVPEPTVGVVQDPKGDFFRVTSLEKVPIIPKSYNYFLELKIINYLKNKGYNVYLDKASGRFELAEKDGIIINDLGPGNIGLTEKGEVKIIDPNIISKESAIPNWQNNLELLK